MYAPFGAGALIGHRDTFEHGAPEHPGGGTVGLVTATDVSWAELPDREEAGSPNVVGAVAMAIAAKTLMNAGIENMARHEHALTAYALDRLRSIPGITVYGRAHGAEANDQLGVIPFNVGSIPHALVAAILGYEGGIGVRSGCFCAQQYVSSLLGIADEARAHSLGDRSDRPGMVRVSFGVYNTCADVDALVAMLQRIAAGDYRGRYELVPATGEYRPLGYDDHAIARAAASAISISVSAPPVTMR
jgi:selenocysteine lyase/cysteine desulfurase